LLPGERDPWWSMIVANVFGGLHIMRLSIMACTGLASFFLPLLTEQRTWERRLGLGTTWRDSRLPENGRAFPDIFQTPIFMYTHLFAKINT
jgi:hypothetical protein